MDRWRLLLAVGSGGLASLSLPPWDAWWLAFVALIPLLLAVREARPAPAALAGFAFGLAFYVTTLWWVVTTMTTYGRMALPMALLALGLLAAFLAGYGALFGWLAAQWPWRSRLAPLGPVALAAVWTGLEILRAHLFSGFPWMLLGYSQHRQPTLRLWAAVAGTYGLSVLVVLVNATLAEALRWALRDRRDPGAGRKLLPAIGILLAALGGVIGYGAWGWEDPATGPALRVALLQGNIDQARKWDREYQAATLEIYERLARRVAAGPPALIVWPETAAPFFLRREPELGGRVARLAGETGSPMLVGAPDVGEDGRLYNSAFLVQPDGRLSGRYDKRHLVPFGEYVPLRQIFFFVDRLAEGIGDFGRGQGATLLTTGGVPFGTMICYEAIFPDEVREFVQEGARFLVNITNDAWFGRTGAPAQHLAMAAMRAVETGTYLVRAANTGYSAVIAPSGAVVEQTPWFTETALAATIRLRTAETPYVRYGDVLGWACAVVTVAGGCVGLARARRRRGGRDGSGEE